MEYESLINKKIGTIDIEKLKPKPVNVYSMEIKEIGAEKRKILSILCKHPDEEFPIQISKAKILDRKIIKDYGLWLSLDENNEFKKNSTIAKLMNHVGIITLKELMGKTLDTAEDDRGYLVFKLY